jgi:hypothetical protein
MYVSNTLVMRLRKHDGEARDKEYTGEVRKKSRRCRC